jgi:7-cyano-7-deazaguanine reductase
VVSAYARCRLRSRAGELRATRARIEGFCGRRPHCLEQIAHDGAAIVRHNDVATTIMSSLAHTLLGRAVDHEPAYSPDLLMPIARATARAELGLTAPLPFVGSDRWTGFELGWLQPGGKPCVAALRVSVPADSPNLIESKSFKLYLNSYARERVDSSEDVRRRVAIDLSTAAGAPVQIELLMPADWPQLAPAELPGTCIDDLDVTIEHNGCLQPEALAADSQSPVAEALVSHLLKSNCPVTGQPDWASVIIDYRGPAIDRAGLLRYLVSFRDVREFHEQCVERIFLDITRRCAPAWLAVEARYTRRGGLDINPYRASGGAPVIEDRRTWRQ